MNRQRVALVAAVGVVGLMAVGCAVGPGLVERRVERLLRAALRDTVDADVTIGAIALSPWSDLPRVGVVLTDVVVANRVPFQGVELARLPRLELGLDLLSAVSGSTLEVERVHVPSARVDVVYDEAGRANWDVLADADATEDPYRLRLQDVVIEDLAVGWTDRATGLVTEVVDVDVQASADLSQDVATVTSRGTIASLTMRYGGITWLSATRWASNTTFRYDQRSGSIQFGENQVTVNALPLVFQGTATPEGEGWSLDLDVAAPEASVAALLSLVPEAYGDPFDRVDAAGAVSLTGSIEGRYESGSDDLPGMKLDLEVRDGRFRFPDLPSSVEQISATVAIRHAQGPLDGVVVDVPDFAVTAGGAALQGRFHVDHPMSDPRVDLDLDGRLDLGALHRALPASLAAPEVDGVLDLDLAVRGRTSDFERGALDAIDADGSVRGKGLRFDHDGAPVELKELDLGMSPRSTTLNALAFRYRGSDGRLTGEIHDLIPWLLTDTPLRGAFTLRSDRLDLRPWQGGGGDQAEGALVVVPTNLDLRLDLDVGTLLTKDLRVDELSGAVTAREGTLRLKGVRGRALGGQIGLDGAYTASTLEQADLDLKLDVERLDLADTVAAFQTLAVIAPLLERAVGAFDGALSLTTRLDRVGAPDLTRLSSAGSLVPRKVRARAAALDALAKQLRRDELAAIDLDGVRVAYDLQRGRVELAPFAARLGPQEASVHGRFGPLDRALDLTLDLPMDTRLLTGLPLLASFGGALPPTADVVVSIEGTLEKPRVKVGLSGKTAEAVVDATLDPLVAAATEQGDRLLAAAREAGQKLLDEAAAAAAAALAAASKQARALRREAKGDPLKAAAAEAAARLLESEGDKAAKLLLREAERTADDLVKVARKQRDALIAEAETKARARLEGGR